VVGGRVAEQQIGLLAQHPGDTHGKAGVGIRYNTWAAVASVLPIAWDVGNGLFCSEFMGLICIAGGYHVNAPWRLSPGELHTILRRP